LLLVSEAKPEGRRGSHDELGRARPTDGSAAWRATRSTPEGTGDREHPAAPRDVRPDFGRADPAGGGPGKLL